MSYMALYRKWRPDEFEEVKGQEHVVTTLKNQITHDRVGHAYLFCGTRGTGKTTVAKLFAKAVNCEHPLADGSPCNECTICKAINAGNSLNVMEIDAASNNGVDNIRDIRQEVQYSPTEGKYKVYIIDEAHMLSSGAFNALLKTLEEPPSYIIFILATTEVHKIPVTICSRCQRYDFRRISLETIYKRLADLLERENVDAEEKAIRYVAKAADGSMRDALSLLDQCIAFYLGQTLTYEKVLEVLGAVDVEVFNRLICCVAANDTMKALEVVDEIVWQGRELSQFVTDFIWYMRNLLLIKTSDHVNDQLDISAENLESMKQAAGQVELESLMRYIRVFSEMSGQIRYATQKRVTLELAVIKLTTPQMETDMESVLDRIRMLEKKMEEGVFSMSEAQLAALADGHNTIKGAEDTEDNVVSKEPPIEREEIIRQALTPAQCEDIKSIMDCIRRILSEEELRKQLGVATANYLGLASINIGQDKKSLILTFEDQGNGALAYKQFSSSEKKHMQDLKDLLGRLTGKQVEITSQLKSSLVESDIGSINLSKVKFEGLRVE
ncbi:MAG: DNA polymerase III subunit gamma/tau [Lachnospiraceae bacterium]|nr:DNA polymerase III subunit gamma/tau [Lachnospiraceae bacterium]